MLKRNGFDGTVFRLAGLLHYFSWSKVVMHSPPEPTSRFSNSKCHKRGQYLWMLRELEQVVEQLQVGVRRAEAVEPPIAAGTRRGELGQAGRVGGGVGDGQTAIDKWPVLDDVLNKE